MASSDVERVKSAIDIIDEIGSRITLKRVGSNYQALCPFHSEKSPSFYVSDSMQRYKCFGCGETGDVFTFLEKYDGMTFGEALRHLAEKAGVTLERRTVDPNDAKRVDILDVLDLAKNYYQYILNEHKAGTDALKYLTDRGITSQSRKIYSLGYATNEWEGLTRYLLQKKKLNPQLVADAGLIIQGRSGWYDRFRDRIMFPLRDSRGVVVGFSGRVLESQAKEAKYINTPETTVYHKGKLLYGFAEHYQAIREKKEIILVEGEFDVISSAQAHVSHVGGLKGSALTQDHVKLLSRTVDRIILSLDSDPAGIEATKRAVSVLQETPLNSRAPMDLRVCVVPSGKDPDEMARKSPKDWRELTKHSVPAYEFLIQTVITQQDVSTAQGKQQVIYEIAPVINNIQHTIEKEHYIQLIAELLQVSVRSVATDITRAKKPLQQKSTTTQDKKPNSRKDPLSKAEMYLLYLWTHMTNAQFAALPSSLLDREWQTPGALQILREAAQHKPATVSALNALLADDLQQLLFEWTVPADEELELPAEKLSAEWDKTWEKVRQLDAQLRTRGIKQELSLLEAKEELTVEEQKKYDTLLRDLAIISAKYRGA